MMSPAAGKDGVGDMWVPEDTVRAVVWFLLVFGSLTALIALDVMFLIMPPHTGETKRYIQRAALNAAEAAALPAAVLWSSAVQVLAALLSLVATGRCRRAVTSLALGVSVATAWLSGRLLYFVLTAVLGPSCCFGVRGQADVVISFVGAALVCAAILPVFLTVHHGDEQAV